MGGFEPGPEMRHPREAALRAASTPEPSRSLVLSRRAAAGLGGIAATALVWAAATTWYIASRDELAEHVFVRQTELKIGYEDRIAGLSTHLEREVTQNLVERRSFDARIAVIAARQGEIEARQTWLRSAAEQAGIAVGADVPARVPIGHGQAGVRPGSEAWMPAPLPDVNLRLRDDAAPTDAVRQPRDRLSVLERAVNAAAADQAQLTASVGRAARTRLGHLRSALDATGLDLGSATAGEHGIGGPLVAVDARLGSGSIGFALADLGSAVTELRRLDKVAKRLPLAAPVSGEPEQTSGFGTRFDPFTRAPALHTGVDFRAETGTAARATGGGRVVAAEYSGGYGNMVEIDHGSGVATRYGHLMSFAVSPGQRVEAGQIVGLTGSTGRSTGPHLHYETRIGGEPVNPSRFLEAGRLLLGRSG